MESAAIPTLEDLKSVNDAFAILQAGLNAVNPYDIIKNSLQLAHSTLSISTNTGKRLKYNLNDFNRIIVVGAGKGTALMTKAIEDLLGDWIESGHIIVQYGYSVHLKKITCSEASHPIPDFNGLKGTQKIISILDKCKHKDLVFCLLSGGGSSLMIQPLNFISLRELQECTEKLILCGANINEINTVRKHISRIKGGQLAKKAYPAKVITLIISDVIGDPLDVIASGPTVPDKTTFSNADHVIRKYNLRKSMARSILHVIKRGYQGQIPETPKSWDAVFRNVTNLIICNNQDMLLASKKRSLRLGYNTKILTSSLSGDIEYITEYFVSIYRKIIINKSKMKTPVCILSGGEPTVAVRGKGLGGRNQELVLNFALEIKNNPFLLFLSVGTDGTDGPTDAAGAFVTGNTVPKTENGKIYAHNYLINNDSYHYFEKSGGLIKTGVTGTNVMDIQILIIR